jgi:hypothetical protein
VTPSHAGANMAMARRGSRSRETVDLGVVYT